MVVSWSVMKSVVTPKGISIQFLDLGDAYELMAFDGAFLVTCNLPKDGGTDVTDFETNFKAKGNFRLDQRDSDGAPLARVKQAPTGWTYQLRGFDFITSTLSSLNNLDHTNVDKGDATLKLYDASGVLITDQATADTSCVRTVIDLEPPYDYYLMGGIAKLGSTPPNPLRISVIAVPDVPFIYGGSRVMISSVNFNFVGTTDKIDADGRASKQLAYSATNHTNKLRIILFHGAGDKTPVGVFLEHFRQ
jgi:hypothetical protein